MLRIIFYTIVVVLILSFFGISIQSIIHSPTGEANFGFLGELVNAIIGFIVTFFASLYQWFMNLIHIH